MLSRTLLKVLVERQGKKSILLCELPPGFLSPHSLILVKLNVINFALDPPQVSLYVVP